MNIKLREIERKDLRELNVWRNDPYLIDQLGTNFRFISQEVENEWFANYLANRDKSVRLAIEVLGKYIGNVNLTQIDFRNRSAEFSIMLGNKSFRRKGVGQKASEMILEHGFSDLGLRRIWLTCLEDNKPALALYSKLGFQLEGVMRDAIYKQGSFRNLLIMSQINNLM
jgi:RimJ/RimL family protein N-acetyltransferase